MPSPNPLAQLLARDPRREVDFPEAPLAAAMAELVALQQPAPAEATPSNAGSADTERMMALLCQVATHVWRAKFRMVDPVTGEPKDETRRLYRHVEGAMEVFAQMGLMINDLINQRYDAGLPIKVLTFQPTPNLLHDTIIEVVRPSIIYQDRLLQMGEVVVGVPLTLASDKP